MGDFADQTAVAPVDGAPGHFTAQVSEDWAIWGPNGGYLTAIALRAAGAVAAIPRPASLTTHFLRTPQFAPVDLAVEVVHAGRRSESLRIAMSQDGKPVLVSMLRTAAEGPGLAHRSDAPDVPGPETLKCYEELASPDWPRFRFWSNLEVRFTEPERLAERKPYPPYLRDWHRFRPRAAFPDRWIDAGRLALLIDTMGWPAAGQPHVNSGFIAPSIECSVAFHDFDPDGEWLLSDQVSPVAAGGLVAAHGRVWSRDGRLLASGGVQMLCAPASR